METKCTWKDCTEAATHEQLGRDGSRWANLCATHDAKLKEILTSGEVPKICGVWVLAQGGAKKAAEKFRWR